MSLLTRPSEQGTSCLLSSSKVTTTAGCPTAVRGMKHRSALNPYAAEAVPVGFAARVYKNFGLYLGNLKPFDLSDF